MTGLLIAETQRFASRRITRFFPLVLGLLIVVGAVIAYFVVQAQDDASISFVDDLANFGGNAVDGIGVAIDQPDFATGILGPLGFLLPIMAFTLGASFFGADQKAGVIELLLTWQPKRFKLLGARAIGGSFVTVLIAAVLSVFAVAVLYGLSGLAGTTEGMTGERWGWIGLAVLRSGLVGGAFVLLGLGLTVLLNNSIASIIAFMIYAFVIENILQLFVGWLAPWLPMANASSFVSATTVARFSVFDDTLPETHHGYLTSGAIVLGFALVAMVVAAIVFNRRDIA